MSTSPTERTVPCPRCRGESRYAADNPYRPFCSERCKTQDFGAWASESYRVESAPTPEDMLLENGSDLVDPTSIPRH